MAQRSTHYRGCSYESTVLHPLSVKSKHLVFLVDTSGAYADTAMERNAFSADFNVVEKTSTAVSVGYSKNSVALHTSAVDIP